jgi:hypothetical protein
VGGWGGLLGVCVGVFGVGKKEKQKKKKKTNKEKK